MDRLTHLKMFGKRYVQRRSRLDLMLTEWIVFSYCRLIIA